MFRWGVLVLWYLDEGLSDVLLSPLLGCEARDGDKGLLARFGMGMTHSIADGDIFAQGCNTCVFVIAHKLFYLITARHF